jgi:hypothetical protein
MFLYSSRNVGGTDRPNRHDLALMYDEDALRNLWPVDRNDPSANVSLRGILGQRSWCKAE